MGVIGVCVLWVGLGFVDAALGGFEGGGRAGGRLCGPVVDIPVVLIEEMVVLSELRGVHVLEAGGGEGGEEQVGF